MLLIGFFCWQLCWGNTGSRFNKLLISQGNTVSTWSCNRGTDNRAGLGSICCSCPEFTASLQPAVLEVEAVRVGCSGHVLPGLENLQDGASSLCGQTCSNAWPLLWISKKKNCLHGIVLSSILCLLSLSLVLPVRRSLSSSSFLSPSGVNAHGFDLPGAFPSQG